MLVSYAPGEIPSELRIECNQGNEVLFSNVESACKRGLPVVGSYKAVEMPAVIVGGGPSLNSTLEIIRHMKECGGRVFALNNAAKYLTENGIRPDLQIIIDSRPGNVSFIEQRWAGELLLASQCHPDLFDQAAKIGYPVRIWHPIIEGIEAHLPKEENPVLVGGGLTVGLSGMCLIYTLGHREMHLFGFDSCHSENKSHAYSQPMNASDEICTVAVDGRVFNCSVTMAAQASSFQRVAEMLAELDCQIFVHGDGLIPHIAKSMTKEAKVLNAVYDLGYSPPTYDFLAFLVEAEKSRIAGGFTDLDIVFQPGPMKGFRYDNLPPSHEERVGMLHRICVSACRLLPSVRNVTILKERQEIKGDVFPEGYSHSTPKSHYGTGFFKNALRCLTATDQAKAEVKKRFQRYATITMRKSEAWPDRNSNEAAWNKVAWQLARMGLAAVFVYDTNDARADIFSWDLDMRLALYEGAAMNLGVSGGPMALCYVSESPYMTFKMTSPNSPSASPEFLAAHGMNEGDQFGENGKVFWCDDEAEKILAALSEWQQSESIAA